MLATSHNRVAAGTTHSRNKPRAARMKQRLWLCSVLGLLLMAFAAVSLSHLRSGRETAAFSCYRLSPSDVEDLVKEVAVPPPLLEPRRQSLETVTLLLVGLPSLHAPDTLNRVQGQPLPARATPEVGCRGEVMTACPFSTVGGWALTPDTTSFAATFRCCSTRPKQFEPRCPAAHHATVVG